MGGGPSNRAACPTSDVCPKHAVKSQPSPPAASVPSVEGPPCDLALAVRRRLPGRRPLVLPAASFASADRGGLRFGSRPAWQTGAIALLDPESDDGTVGAYELLYLPLASGGDVADPVLRLPLGPRGRVVRRSPQVAEFSPHGLSVDERYAVTFASSLAADAFVRDVSVRLRVMQLSWRQVRGNREAEDLADELELLRARGGLMRLVRRCVFLLLIVAFLRFAILVLDRTPEDAASTVLQDAGDLASSATVLATQAGVALCTNFLAAQANDTDPLPE
eukprot:TRINITY_DN65365_c0_g1_i1.p1 TRINITY_DN65365_c0_g1~~TRINITY_DN65365_c0_g1_i1.p1  ORF type:complete len:277 (-),score=46.12 TRINITY_DN65365_c0_g1_i1:120-950(-)